MSHTQLAALRQHTKEPGLGGERGPADSRSQPAGTWVRLSGTIWHHQLLDVCSCRSLPGEAGPDCCPTESGASKTVADSKPGVKLPLPGKSLDSSPATHSLSLSFSAS